MTAAEARSAELRDGRAVLVRPIGPDDKALVADAFHRMSDEASRRHPHRSRRLRARVQRPGPTRRARRSPAGRAAGGGLWSAAAGRAGGPAAWDLAARLSQGLSR